MRVALVLLLLLGVAAGMFALAARATDPVEIDALGRVAMRAGGFRLTAPFGVVLSGATALGLLLGILVMAPGSFSSGRRARQAEKRLTEVEVSRSEAAAARAQAAAERSTVAASTSTAGAAEAQRLADEASRRAAPPTGEQPPQL